MVVHSERYFKVSTQAVVPTREMQEMILYECEKSYESCVWTLPDGFLSREAFEVAVRRLDMTSSPGIPYQREYPTNGEWLHWNGVECDLIQLDRLWHDVNLVLADKWKHYLRVFIKQEPHKKKKVEEKRWRLIMAASLPVQIAWHMLFDYLNDLEIKNAYFIPSQQGAIFVRGGWKQFLASWRSRGLTCGLDKSAWDWTAPYWALKLDLELRRRLGRGDRLDEWYRLATMLYRHMFETSELVTSDGCVYRQLVPGIMKSGCVNTISTNSHCQIFIHIAVCVSAGWDIHPLPVACGDDTLQHERHTTDLSLYKKYGMQVKSVSDTAEFMGHEFRGDGPAPMYVVKHLKKVVYVKDENLLQYLDSMARMYVHVPEYRIWELVARGVGMSLPMSRDAYRYWYDVSA